MKRQTNMEDRIADVRYRGGPRIRERIRSHLNQVWQRRMAQRCVPVRFGFGGGTLARLSQAALVALLLVVAGVWLVQINKSGGAAYALGQTADALKGIRYFHFQFISRPKEPAREAWIEYDPNESMRSVRVNFYDQNSVMVWSPDVTQYWNWDRHEVWVFRDDEYTEKVLYFVERHDPRQAIAYLQQRGGQGGIQIDIDQPQASADPVIVTVAYDPNTYLIGKAQPAMREFYHIDALTKLITSIDVETLWNGRYTSKGAWEYIDYNQPFHPNTFDLTSETGADVTWSDTTGIVMGIEQGPLSDEEAAVKLVQEFLDAWVAEDYDKAAQLHGSIATGEAERIAGVLRKRNILHVVSVGPPVRAESPLRGLLVPTEVEYEKDGQRTMGQFNIHVSRYAQGRWRIRDLGMGR
jgi:hypothetical protein